MILPSSRSDYARPRRRLALAAALGLVLSATVSAHDFWIAPSSFRPALDSRISLELLAGQRFQGEAITRNPEKIQAFFALDERGSELSVPGIDGKSPAGMLRARGEGLLWVGYHSQTTSIELNGERFEAYLADEGLERISDLRRSRSESQRPGKEIYSRCAKALLCVGGSGDKGFDRRLGFPLEIMADANPYGLAPGRELPVHVVYQDRALEGALVGCMAKGRPDGEVRVRTDREGRAKFVLDRSDVWLVRVVHMVPAPPASGADWESLWGSLTFELPPSSAPSATNPPTQSGG